MQFFFSHWNRHQHLRFLLTGFWNTLAGYAIFVLLYTIIGERTSYLCIAVTAHILAVTNSFIMQRKLVFRSKNRWVTEYIRFNLTHLTTLGLGIGFLSLLVEKIQIEPVVAQAFTALIITPISYLAHKKISFNKK